MDREDFYCLGKILKPYGRKGHLLVFLDADEPGKYASLTTVFIGIENQRIPFFLESVELKPGGKAVFKFEDINSPEDAEPFPGLQLFLPLSSLPSLKGKKFYYHEVTGFTVSDENHGEIGILTSVIDMPRQALLQIKKGGTEILVPLTDEVLVRVDRKKRILYIRAPEGLIDLYL
jgi:16S rRNA processing protein RimM